MASSLYCRSYQVALARACAWGKTCYGHDFGLIHWDNDLAEAYLAERTGEASQKTLDIDRQALQLLPGVTRLMWTRSAWMPDIPRAPPAFTAHQVKMICEAQHNRHRLATEIAYATGLYAHELLTLRPADEQPASGHRDWSEYRFTGRPGKNYSVIEESGECGLVREVRLPDELADRLASVRLTSPREFKDRDGLRYEHYYGISGGYLWSGSFRAASQRALGVSHDALTLRNAYAHERMDELQGRGFDVRLAMVLVSQEMGRY